MINAFFGAFGTFLSQSYYGNTLLQLSLFAASVAAFLVFGRLLMLVFERRIRKFSEKTKTRMDNVLADTAGKSFWLVMLTLGIIIGAQFLSVGAETMKTAQAIFGVSMTLLFAWILTKLVDAVAEHYIVPFKQANGQRIDESIISVFKNIFKAIIIVAAIALILTDFGYNVTAILAGLGIGGIAIAFAAQQTIADVFGGVSILTSKPFRAGDTILVEGITGTVKKVGIRTTRIRGIDNSEIMFSNSKLSGSIVKNLSAIREQRVELNLGLAYNTGHEKLQEACDLLKKIILVHEGCADNPTIFFSEFRDSSLNIQVVYFITGKDWMKVRHEINMKIKEEFDRHKIEFAFPTYTIHMAK